MVRAAGNAQIAAEGKTKEDAMNGKQSAAYDRYNNDAV